jgi:hypothetical protein
MVYQALLARWRQLAVAAVAVTALSLAAATTSGPPRSVAAEPPAPDTSATGPTGFVNVEEVHFQLSSDRTGVTFQCRLDADSWEGCGEVWYVHQVPDGPHTFEGRAVSESGVDPTPARLEFVLDREKPTAYVRPGWEPTSWTSEAQPTFYFSTSEPATLACAFDGAAPGPCGGPDWHRPPAPLALGAHQFHVVATDRAGNVATAGRTFSVIPPPVMPKISVGKPRLALSSGRASLPVKVNRVGGVRLLSKAAKAASRGAKSAGTVWLPVIPVGKAAKALAADGKAKVGVLVRFWTVEGTVEKATVLTLRKRL